MRRILLPAGFAVIVGLTVLSVRSLHANQINIAAKLGLIDARLAGAARADDLAALRAENAALLDRLARSERRLSELARASDLAAAREEITTIRYAVAAIEAASRERFARLEGRLDTAATEALKARRAATDPAALLTAVLLPSVQVSARGGVGGGTIIYSAGGDSFAVTAFHVIAKTIVKDDSGAESRLPVDVKIYRLDGTLDETVASDLVAFDDRKDIALLKLRSPKVFPAARLRSRDRLKELGVFTPIYAVGCPLGHDPMPSLGEISTLRKEVNGEKFWMMNAPTIFGNSGGGVFHRETHELLGVSAMICTFDNPVTTPVPHLGILLPLEGVYDWLTEHHYQFLFDVRFSRPGTPKDAGVARARREW